MKGPTDAEVKAFMLAMDHTFLSNYAGDRKLRYACPKDGKCLNDNDGNPQTCIDKVTMTSTDATPKTFTAEKTCYPTYLCDKTWTYKNGSMKFTCPVKLSLSKEPTEAEIKAYLLTLDFATLSDMAEKEEAAQDCSSGKACKAGAQGEVQKCAKFTLTRTSDSKSETEEDFCESSYMCDKTWTTKDGTLKVECSASKLVSAAAAFTLAMAATI